MLRGEFNDCFHEKTSVIVIKVKDMRGFDQLVRHEVCRGCQTVIMPTK